MIPHLTVLTHDHHLDTIFANLLPPDLIIIRNGRNNPHPNPATPRINAITLQLRLKHPRLQQHHSTRRIRDLSPQLDGGRVHTKVDVSHTAAVLLADVVDPGGQLLLAGEEEEALAEEDLEGLDVDVLAGEEDAGDGGAAFGVVLAFGLDRDGLSFEDELVDLGGGQKSMRKSFVREYTYSVPQLWRECHESGSGLIGGVVEGGDSCLARVPRHCCGEGMQRGMGSVETLAELS